MIIGWNGGECPVNPDDEVRVWLRCGDTDTWKASQWNWHHSPPEDRDIIAYEVIKKAPRISYGKVDALIGGDTYRVDVTYHDGNRVAIHWEA